jgi:tetratricopeptide (TPR) repeat protein
MKKIGIFLLVISFLTSGLPAPAHAAPKTSSMKVIRVGVAVTPGVKAMRNWRGDFERRLAYASRIFEAEFKIKFVPAKWYEWPTVSESDTTLVLIEDLMSRYPLGDVDIMIGLSRLPAKAIQANMDPRDLDTLGQARPFSGYLVLRYPIEKLFRIQEETVLVHELAHLFGAIHTGDSSSIMYPIVDKQLPSRFDRENHEIITQTRAMDFKKGLTSLPPMVLQRLLGSYLKLAARDQSFDFYYTLGVLYLTLGQMDDALGAWKMAVSINPNHPRIHFDLGILYYKIGDYQNAVKELTQAVQGFKFRSQNLEKVQAFTVLGDIYMSQNNTMGAYQAYSRGLQIDRENPTLKANLAFVAMANGQYDEAIREFDKMLVKEPNNVKALINLGIAYFNKERYSDSERYFKRVLPLTQNKNEVIQIHNYLGKIYYKTNQSPEAIKHFRSACAMDMNPGCLKGLAQIHYQLGQWDDCIQALVTVLQKEKDDPDVYGTLAVALMQKGDYDNAVGLLQEGLRYAKDKKTEARFHKNLGYVFNQKQHFDIAEKEFHIAIANDWNNVESHFGLALACLGRQNPVGAKEALENVLKLDPQNKKAKELLQNIDKMLKDAPQMQVQLEGTS